MIDLIGVVPLNDVKVTSTGRSTFKFISIIDGTKVSSFHFGKHLKKHGLTRLEYLLRLNSLSKGDLPSCEFCSKSVVLDDRSGLITPKLKVICGSTKCSKRLGRRTFYESTDKKHRSEISRKAYKTSCVNGTYNLSNSSIRSENSKKAYLTRMNRGNYKPPSAYLSSSEISKSRRKGAYTQIRRKVHSFINYGKVKLVVGGTEHNFKSNAEKNFFIRTRRFLQKYYNREVIASCYDSNRPYVADYILKHEFHGSNLPEVIEVKSGNITRCHYSNKTGSINYKKFRSILDKGWSLLIIDQYPNRRNLIMVRSYQDLDDLFVGIEDES